VENEDVIDSDLEICDPHHHLWDLASIPAAFAQNLQTPLYLLPHILDDLGKGHNITSTIYIEARSFLRADGPEEFACVGETEFANGVAAMSASGRYGSVRLCEAIVTSAELRLGARARPVLEAHVAVGGGRLRGVRQSATNDPTGSAPVHAQHRPPPSLLLRPDFREGFALLREFNLSFDAWLYHPQLHELLDLARTFPDQSIILNHVGGPLGIGHFAGKRQEVFRDWSDSIKALATCPNISVKLGGLGMYVFGFEFASRPVVSSEILARAWGPYVEACIEAFGVERCMFESNTPVDLYTCDYKTLWNAYKRITAGYSTDERRHLFRDTARRTYRLSSEPAPGQSTPGNPQPEEAS
jgi:predicted TIM-barrel fold metal-dependent hydrolase